MYVTAFDRLELLLHIPSNGTDIDADDHGWRYVAS